MDEDTLHSLWASTLGGLSPEDADPNATYTSPGAGGSRSAHSNPLPSVSVADPTGIGAATVASSEGGESQRDGDATTVAGEGSPLGRDESSIPTLVGAAQGSDPSGAESALGGAPVGPGEASYELREILGAGGMGVVYRAQQTSLQRDVALKKVLSKRSGERWQRKFVGEAHVTGQLAHPNIVPVYDLGAGSDGEAVLAMKLVDGITWKRLLGPRTDAEQELAETYALEGHLRIFDQVCNAVSFAHSRQLAHLDLKPENVLIGEFGEVLVMDWGLAVSFSNDPQGDDSRIPHKSDLVAPCGTPSYMAPELARGVGTDVGPWTDVYLLGAILCELLTGRPPHRGKSLHKVVTQAVYGKPPVLDPSLPQELRVACLRAVARAPEDRFQTVAELQAAVRDYLRHRESGLISESAREQLDRCVRVANEAQGAEASDSLYTDFASAVAGFAQALVLWEGNEPARDGEWAARLAYAEAALGQDDLGLAASLARALTTDDSARQAQKRVLLGRVERREGERRQAARNATLLRYGLGAAVVVLVAGLTVGTALIGAARDRAEENREVAEAARAEAERDRALARYHLAGSLVDQGDVLGSTGRWSEARDRFGEARRTWAELGKTSFAAELGELAADRNSPRPLLELSAHEGPVSAIAFAAPSGEGRGWLASGGSDGRLLVWDLLRGVVRQTLDPRQGVLTDLAASPDGRRLASAGSNGTIRIWDTRTWEPLRTLEGHAGAALRLRFSPGSTRLLSGGSDGTVRVWNPRTGEAVSVCEGHALPVVALAWRGEGWAFSATASGELIWWNTEQGSVHWRYRDAVEGGVSDMAFRPVEAQLAFASPDHTVKVWEFDAKLNNFAPVRELSAHRGSVTAVAYTPDGSRLLSVGLDAWISVAAAVTGEGDREVGLAQRSGARDVAVSWDGGFVATAGQDGVVRVWDLGLATLNPTGAEAERVVIAMHAGADEQFTTGALSPDGLLAVSGAASGRVTLWDVRTGRRLKNLDVHQTGVVHTSFHGGGEELLTVSSDGQVRVWTLNGLVPAASHDAGADLGRTVNAASVAVVASSIRLLLGAGTGKVQVLERRGGEFAAGEVWEAHAAVASVALSPDGERAWTSGTAASGASEGLKGWRVQSRLLGGVTPTAQPQRALSVSPDGQRLLGGDGGGRLTVWDVREGMRSTFSRVLHADAAVAVAFVGKDLVCSAGRDERWRLVDVEHGRELRAFAEEGTVVSTDVSSDGRRVLSVRPGALRVFDLQQTRVHDALDAAAAKTRTTRSGGADGLADRELGRWFAFQGSLRAAIVLLEESRAAGASADDRLLFESYWRLGRYAAAADAFERFAARGSFPSYYMKLVRGALAERVETLGSRLGREPDLVHAVVFSPDGRAVVTSSDSGVLHLWDVASGRLLHVLLGHDAGILSVAFSPNGKRVASGDRKGGLRLWDTLSGEELHSVEVGKEYVSALAFFPGSEAVAIGCYDKTLRVLNAIDGTLRVLRKGEHSVASVAVSADGRRVAVGGSRGQVELVEVESGAVLSSWTADRSTVEGVAFLADGRLLTAGSGSRGIAVWNVATGERLSGSEKQFDTIYGFGVTPDGSRAVTAGGRGGVMIYEVATGQVVEAWRLERVLLAAAISPDGRRVVLGARDGHLIVRSVSR